MAVINQDDEEEVGAEQVMLSDGDEDGQDFEDDDESHGLYAHQGVNCFPGDSTEAYEKQACVDLNQDYHQFSQSDYVEAVEGFNPEEDD